MANPESKQASDVRINRVDAILATYRQRVILELIHSGKLDSTNGMKLYEKITELNQIAEDREAFESRDLEKDSPSIRMNSLLLKTKPNKRRKT